MADLDTLAAAAPGAAPEALAATLAEVRALASEMTYGSKRLERIAGDLRIIASPDAPAEELVDPAEAIESAFLLARSRFASMPRLEMDVEAGPPIESVGRLLTQGLVPVVENAVLTARAGRDAIAFVIAFFVPYFAFSALEGAFVHSLRRQGTTA